MKTIFSWGNPAQRQDSQVVQMIDQGFAAAKAFGKAILLLDRYFLSETALVQWKEANASTAAPLHLVTKAKANAVACEHPPKKGSKIKMKELFQTRASKFQTATVTMYGKEETVQYLCLDLLWGKGLCAP
ncbi:hypothetical protein [Paenibacillus ehimensis]|uniref:hypothetical protein n=1 Tax=Paenibacillus ehimensis TaxID=79264 RepID=UPI0026770002|nr:hypothetical protein [Paenibacillus ehimensis]